MTETTKTRTWRKLIDENSQVPIEISQPAETLVKVEDEKFQPTEPPPRRTMPEKRSKAQQSTTQAYYPFISAKVKRLFIEIIQGKKTIKERALDLEIFGIGK